MKIYHIAMTKRVRVPSGGETCMIALIKYLREKHCENIILTTKIGKEEFEKSGLTEDGRYIKYRISRLTLREANLQVFLAWIIATIKAADCIKNLTFRNNDVIICYSYFFPDYLTAHFCKNKNQKLKVFYWYHMLTPHLFYGYEGEFTKKKQFPRLNIIFYQFNQLLFSHILKKNDVILTVSKYYKEILKRIFPNNEIYHLRHFGGGDSEFSIKSQKKFDMIWVGRFHVQKGIFQFIDIVERVAKKLKNIRTIVIGGGDDKIEKKFLSEIQLKHLDKNINYLGPITDSKKYLSYLRSSKLFIMTSTYEGFGLVNLEAMKQGLPVVAYNLPVFESLKKGMITVPIFRNDEFSIKVLDLLKDREYYNRQAQISYKHSLSFSWDKMGKEVHDIITDKYV